MDFNHVLLLPVVGRRASYTRYNKAMQGLWPAAYSSQLSTIELSGTLYFLLIQLELLNTAFNLVSAVDKSILVGLPSRAGPIFSIVTNRICLSIRSKRILP